MAEESESEINISLEGGTFYSGSEINFQVKSINDSYLKSKFEMTGITIEDISSGSATLYSGEGGSIVKTKEGETSF